MYIYLFLYKRYFTFKKHQSWYLIKPNKEGKLRCFRGVIVKATDYRNVKKFEFQSFYYDHFRTNTLGKCQKSPNPQSYGLNSNTTVLLEEWHQMIYKDWYAIKTTKPYNGFGVRYLQITKHFKMKSWEWNYICESRNEKWIKRYFSSKYPLCFLIPLFQTSVTHLGSCNLFDMILSNCCPISVNFLLLVISYSGDETRNKKTSYWVRSLEYGKGFTYLMF